MHSRPGRHPGSGVGTRQRGAVGVQWGWNSSEWRGVAGGPGGEPVAVGNWLEVLGLVQRPLPY